MRPRIASTASTAVLPVTAMRPLSTLSRKRLRRAPAVGAKNRLAMRSTTTRFISSGQGRPRSWLRSPASTWAMGTPA